MSENLDVLVPHYRDPEGLIKSLDSIEQQTWQGEIRVIVVDDGSPQEEFARVEQVCAAFRAKGVMDVLLLRNEQNLGRPKTRNRLLENTSATYVAWLDAGDIWYPQKLALQFEHLLRLRYAGQDVDTIWVSCAYDWHQLGQTRPRRLQQETAGDQVKGLLIGHRLRAYLWTLLGTARAFRIAGVFDERLPRLQDLDYFLNFVRGGGQIVVPPSTTALCCYFKSDIGRNAQEISKCHKLIQKKHRPAILRYSPALASELRYKGNRLAARFALSNGERVRAMGYLAEAAITAPRHSARVFLNVLGKSVKVQRGKK